MPNLPNISAIDASPYQLNNLNKINIILGKNGCGKSTTLRRAEEVIFNQTSKYGKVKYISPERGGALIYNSGIEQNFTSDQNWIVTDRRRNQVENFRQQSFIQCKNLETTVLRDLEYMVMQGENSATLQENVFDVFITKINSLLENIFIKRVGGASAFDIYSKSNPTQKLDSNSVSSGEKELISLGIECLVFSKGCVEDKENYLFLDEPDVHLHPDLQVRLMHFLRDLVSNNNFQVVISTHSTAILGALESYQGTHLAFMTAGQKELDFKAVSEIYRRVLPVFGAHPLSNIFNEAPILLVEGEDDERIWQQAVRSSNGKIKIYPCAVDTITKLQEFEPEVQKIIQTVYNDAKGYSLRDLDESTDEITDLLPLIRMKLSCRNAENLLLTDEVLADLGINWDELKNRIESWLSTNSAHNHFAVMNGFKNSGYDRKKYDVKEVRNDLMGIIGKNKPWEVAVGQTIAKQVRNDNASYEEDGKILSYLGKKVVENLIPKKI